MKLNEISVTRFLSPRSIIRDELKQNKFRLCLAECLLDIVRSDSEHSIHLHNRQFDEIDYYINSKCEDCHEVVLTFYENSKPYIFHYCFDESIVSLILYYDIILPDVCRTE